VAALSRTRHRYGRHPSQVADLWQAQGQAGPLPVVVLYHGGFWRFAYTKRIMNGLAAAIASRGLAVWNVEYRRLGMPGGGWPGTFEDAEAALNHVAEVDGLDHTRVVSCGHSAGGHLSLWVAGRNAAAQADGRSGGVVVTGALSLAGVSDLRTASNLGLGNGAVDRLLGTGAQSAPGRYEACSPIEMLPMGLPQVLVHGLSDVVVPATMSEEYCKKAEAAGDNATFVPLDGVGHRELINPRSLAWASALTHLEALTC
jgi:acetyl esterase/lipase